MSLRSTSMQTRLFEGDGARLVRRLVEHGGKTEELARRRLIDHHFLMVFVHRGHPHLAGHQDVGLPAGVPDLVDALARRKTLHLHLAGQDGGLLVVEQSEERDTSQHIGVAGHGSPQLSGSLDACDLSASSRRRYSLRRCGFRAPRTFADRPGSSAFSQESPRSMLWQMATMRRPLSS